MDEQERDESSQRGWHKSLVQSPREVAGQAPESDGVAIANRVMGLEGDLGGGVKSTSLAKREC